MMTKAWRNTLIILVTLWMVWTGLGLWIYNHQDLMLDWVTSRAMTGGQSRTVGGTLPFDGITALRIRSTSGTVELRRTTDHELRYGAVLWAWNKGAESKLSGMGVRAEAQGGTIILESFHETPDVSNAGINYIVYVPDGLNLDLSLVNGTVKGDALISQNREWAMNVVNGTINLRLGFASGADLKSWVTNGKVSVTSDGLDVAKTLGDSRHYDAQINGGGSRVSISAINGTVKLDLGKP